MNSIYGGQGSVKGLNRKVIEIVEPNSEFVERVIVILKPGVAQARLREEQENLDNYVSAVCCKKKKISGWWIAAAAAAVLGAALLIALL